MESDNKNIIDWELLSGILANSANSTDKQRFEDWISIEKNKLYFEEIKKVWDKTNDISYCYDIETNSAWEKVSQKTLNKSKNTWKIGTRVFQMAAAILVLFLIGKYVFTPNKIKIESGNAIVEDYNLPDGSTVSLNANSTLEFEKDFEGDKRQCWLKGEAFFDVEKNPNKPFVINLDKGAFEVLGTSFNIKESSNKGIIELTVKTGKVKFTAYHLNKSVTVNKNQALQYDIKNYKIIQLKNVDPNFLAWKDKIITFDKTSLSEVVECLKSAYNKNIEIKNNKIKELKFSASFNNQSLEKILKVVALTFDIEIKHVNKKIELH